MDEAWLKVLEDRIAQEEARLLKLHQSLWEQQERIGQLRRELERARDILRESAPREAAQTQLPFCPPSTRPLA